MRPLETGQLAVMRIHAAIGAGAAIALGVVGGLILESELGVPVWALPAALALLLAYPTLGAPARQWRGWSYDARDRELKIAHGVYTKTQTVVPYGRVQHIDVSQGPIERSFGVARLMLHTAGTAHSLVTLPGLTRENAEGLRDEIREHIRRETG